MAIATNDKRWKPILILASILIPAVVFLLLSIEGKSALIPGVDVYFFPKLNAMLNTGVTLCLLVALYFIKQKNITAHRNAMLTATGLSVLFLVSYILYHAQAPSTPFGGEGAIRYIYYFVLVSHILLAMVVVPLVLFALYRGLSMDVPRHRKIVRWAYPIWLYVSITGVLVYLMIAPYYPA